LLDAARRGGHLTRVNNLNYIERANSAWVQNGRVEATHAPMGRSGVEIVDTTVKNALLYAATVARQSGAGLSRSGELKSDSAGPKLMTGAPKSMIDSARRQIFAESAVVSM
jgi:hypothetical protein